MTLKWQLAPPPLVPPTPFRGEGSKKLPFLVPSRGGLRTTYIFWSPPEGGAGGEGAPTGQLTFLVVKCYSGWGGGSGQLLLLVPLPPFGGRAPENSHFWSHLGGGGFGQLTFFC